MRSVIISTLILVLVVTFCISSAFHVSALLTKVENMLQQAVRETNSNHASQLVIQASEFWKKHEGYLAMVRCHDELDLITGDIARLVAYSISPDLDDFRSTCYALLINLKHIRDAEWPYYFNIL